MKMLRAGGEVGQPEISQLLYTSAGFGNNLQYRIQGNSGSVYPTNWRNGPKEGQAQFCEPFHERTSFEWERVLRSSNADSKMCFLCPPLGQQNASSFVARCRRRRLLYRCSILDGWRNQLFSLRTTSSLRPPNYSPRHVTFSRRSVRFRARKKIERTAP